MAKNRATKYAPQNLTTLSKTSLAELVWQLASVAPECASCDDAAAITEALAHHAGVDDETIDTGISARDRRTIEKLRDFYTKPKLYPTGQYAFVGDVVARPVEGRDAPQLGTITKLGGGNGDGTVTVRWHDMPGGAYASRYFERVPLSSLTRIEGGK